MDKSGQLAPDYMVTVILLGIIALAMLAAYQRTNIEALKTIEKIHATELANMLTREINGVLAMGDGAERSITLSRTMVGGRAYNITLRSNAVLVSWGGADAASRFSTGSVNGTEIRLEPGEILIRNMDGVIYLEKIE